MYRFRFLIISLTIFITSCTQNSDKIMLKGEIDGNPPSSVKILELLPNGSQFLDSASIINGKFKYAIPRSESGFYQLIFSAEETFLFAAKGGETLLFKGNFTMGKRTFTMEGSAENDIFMEMNQRLDECYVLTDSLAKILTKAIYQEDYLEIKKSIDESYQNAFQKHRQWLKELINKNSKSLISLMAYYQALGNNRFFDDYQDFEWMSKIHENLSQDFSNNIHFEHFSKNYQRIKFEIEENKKILSALEIGKPIPNLSFFTESKGVVSPKNFQGKPLILFFWSFISKSSIDIIPLLKKLSAEKNIQVLAISFEKNEDKAHSFSSKHLNFATFSNEEKMFESLAAKTYNIKSTPAFILVDKEGKIVVRTHEFNELKQSCVTL